MSSRSMMDPSFDNPAHRTPHVSFPLATVDLHRVRGLLTPCTEYYALSPMFVCPLLLYRVSSATSTSIPIHSSKDVSSLALAPLVPPLARCRGGLRTPPIRCQRLREYTQAAHARVEPTAMARVSQPRRTPVALVGRLACAACLRSVLPTGRHLGRTQPFSVDRLDGTGGCIINMDRSTDG